jgi:hypothetical protein
MFHQLRRAAMAYDAALRQNFSAAEIETLRGLLARLAENVKSLQGEDRGKSA